MDLERKLLLGFGFAFLDDPVYVFGLKGLTTTLGETRKRERRETRNETEKERQKRRHRRKKERKKAISERQTKMKQVEHKVVRGADFHEGTVTRSRNRRDTTRNTHTDVHRCTYSFHREAFTGFAIDTRSEEELTLLRIAVHIHVFGSLALLGRPVQKPFLRHEHILGD
jgi:hypothetical protein